MSTDSIINFVQIDERIATGGQPTTAQLQAAQQEGYQAIINLAPGNAENALPDEAGTVQSLGMSYHHIPVEWSAPTREQFFEFTSVMKELMDKKMLIHCAANYRVTAFFALYAMQHEGWSLAQADELIARIWESRPDYRMDETWKSFLRDIQSSGPLAP